MSMWKQTIESTYFGEKNQNEIGSNIEFEKYIEDDDTTTDTTGRTFSTTQEQQESQVFLHQEATEDGCLAFEKLMKDPANNRVSNYQNTYFMDGGKRFISLPTLGNTCTKAASHISRVFEDWLQNKLYHQHVNDGLERLPILEDSVELLAEDIINKLKSRNSVKGITSLSRILIQVRTGHVYTYHQLNNGQPLITPDMEDFFQQFPLFVEIIIHTMPKDSDQSMDDIQLLLSLENITFNPNDPYYIKQDIQLIV